jgi:AraC-like DNA-binding protein
LTGILQVEKGVGMHPDDNIEAMLHAGYYKAPGNRRPNPVQIKEGCEYIELLTGGRVLFDDGRGEREFSCGTIFWHLPGENTIWNSVLSDPYECFVVLFKMKGVPSRCAPRVTSWAPHETKIFAEDALRAVHDDSFDRGIVCNYIHSRLLWAAYGDGRRRDATESLPPPLAKALSVIAESFAEALDVSDLASEARVSVPYLHALFKRHLGCSPHQRLLDRRLQEARHLLDGSDLNLKTVAFNCGFPSVEHFCRIFKRRFGCTATDFRRSRAPSAFLGR